MIRTLFIKTINRSSSKSSFFLRKSYATFNNKRIPKEEFPGSQTIRNGFEQDLQHFVETTQEFSNIIQFKKSIIQQYNSKLLTEKSFDAIFMRICLACRKYNLGKAFLDHLTQDGQQANTATLSKFLSLCYHCRDEINDKSEVEKLCTLLQSRSMIFDSNTKESIILALSITDRWKEGLSLLAEDETTHHSMPMNAMVDCLLYHDDLENAISWMDKMVLKERPIFEFVYQHWIKKCAIHPGGWTILSNFLHRNSVFLKQSIAHQLKELLESQAIKSPFVGRFTTVEETSGRCQACHQILKSTSISDEEFTALKERLMEKVLLGTDVFLGSRPEEMKKFHKFIEKTAPYDVVIDGLNVAYHNSVQSRNQPGRKVEALLSVVKHFTNQNLRVLILTRKHLLREPVLSNIKQRAYVFITDDLSRDDPFLLYAAVQSKYTKFVSDDLFRDHIFRLGDPRLEALFRTWQHSAQIQIIKFMKDGSVKFHHPRKYRTVVQFAEGSWHIPYDDGTPRFSYQVPNTWLCLQPQTLSGKNGIK